MTSILYYICSFLGQCALVVVVCDCAWHGRCSLSCSEASCIVFLGTVWCLSQAVAAGLVCSCCTTALSLSRRHDYSCVYILLVVWSICVSVHLCNTRGTCILVDTSVLLHCYVRSHAILATLYECLYVWAYGSHGYNLAPLLGGFRAWVILSALGITQLITCLLVHAIWSLNSGAPTPAS